MPLLYLIRVRQVRLQGDARADLLQTRPLQRPHEGLGGDTHVPVLFHVQVHELRHLGAVRAPEPHPGGLPIQQLQAVAQGLDRVLPRQRRDLGVDGGDLHRDALDLGALQELQIALQPPLHRLLPEHRLAEEVEIHAQPRLVPRPQMGQQMLLLSRQDHVGRLLPQLLLNHRDRHPGKVAPEGAESPEQGLVQPGEEPRNPLHIQDVDELIRSPRGIARAQGLIGDLNQGRLVVRAQRDPLQLILLPCLLSSQQLRGPLLQDAGDMDRLLDRLRDVRPGVRLKPDQQGLQRLSA